MTRAVLGILMVGALLFIADQEFADGRYTRMAEKAMMKVRNAVGF
jgi:hypothetical protein